MGETSNFYEKCSSLSKKGDEKSLRTLLQMGISGNKKDNQKCIADFEKISLIYLAVKENVWDYGEMDFYHNSISIAFKLCRNEELTSSDGVCCVS